MKHRGLRRLKRVVALLAAVVSMAAGAAAGESVFTQAMTERSLVAIGNTERLHRAMEKGQNGEAVTIAYLGGSITEGALAQPQATHCYAALSAKQFAERYMSAPEKLQYINAGISGTPSLLGITRLEQDVLRHQPDIVFVEFAVNDSGDWISQNVYESLLRKLLTSESEPAVILLFTVLSGGHSCQEHMSMLGKHYNLGMISVKDAIWPEIEQGTMGWSDYSSDYAHPTTAGHAFVADLIAHYLEQAAAVHPEPYAMPRFIRVGNMLEDLENIRQEDTRIVSAGSFLPSALSCYSYQQGWWHNGAVNGTDAMKISLEGACMTVAFKQMKDSDWGMAEVWVDGECKATLPGYSQDAWGNVQTQLITFASKGPHMVEIRMAEGEEEKNFQLLDLAVAP